MDKVIIKDLLVRGIIGVNDWERKKKQDILVNVIMFTDIKRAAEEDNIEFTPNYRSAAKGIAAHIESSEPFTVEKLASDIADICLKDGNVDRVLVRVEKPGAVRFAKSVGVEVERERSG
ncbi:MAG: dihydroneopterin aldolase [Anaerolineae bacterium]|nr:dihydroneopterin aldolase [Anaerolineae bacterium]